MTEALIKVQKLKSYLTVALKVSYFQLNPIKMFLTAVYEYVGEIEECIKEERGNA